MNSNTAPGKFSKIERKITTFHPPADVQNLFSRQKKTPKQLGVSREHTRFNGSRCSVISGGSGRWDTTPTAAFCQPQHWLFTRDITLYMRANLQLSRLAPVCFLAWNWRRDTTPAAGWLPGVTLDFTRDITCYIQPILVGTRMAMRYRYHLLALHRLTRCFITSHLLSGKWPPLALAINYNIRGSQPPLFQSIHPLRPLLAQGKL